MSEKERLIGLYWQRKSDFEKASKRRMWMTIGGFSLWYSLFFVIGGQPDTLGDFASAIFVSCLLGGLHFWVNFYIINSMLEKDRDEAHRLENIAKQIDEIEAKEKLQK